MSMIEVISTEQDIEPINTIQHLEVRSSTQYIIVNPQTGTVAIINAGPQGPPGIQGEVGPPGPSGEIAAEEALDFHIMNPTPHAAYDDMASLSSWFNNQLA